MLGGFCLARQLANIFVGEFGEVFSEHAMDEDIGFIR